MRRAVGEHLAGGFLSFAGFVKSGQLQSAVKLTGTTPEAGTVSGAQAGFL